MLGQDPPIYRRSMTAKRFPREASVQAGSLPAAPLPRTTRSYSSAADMVPSAIGDGLAPPPASPKSAGDRPADRQPGRDHYRAGDPDVVDVGSRPPGGRFVVRPGHRRKMIAVARWTGPASHR